MGKKHRYRHKEIVVEAYQVDQVTQVETDEGIVIASPGDYIVEYDGKLFRVEKSIFRSRYERLD